MFTVEPIGMTNLVIRGSMPFFSSRQPMESGSVAELEDVPKAVTSAFAIFAMKIKGFFFVRRKYIPGNTRKPCMSRAINTVKKYIPSWPTISSSDFISVIFAATRESTPIGDSLRKIFSKLLIRTSWRLDHLREKRRELK